MSTDNYSYALRLPTDDYNRLKSISSLTGRSINSLIVEAVHNFVSGTDATAHFEALRVANDTYQQTIRKLAGEQQ